MDGASHATLENEFGTHVDEEVIKQILEKGTLQETEVHTYPTLSHVPLHQMLINLVTTGGRPNRFHERQHGYTCRSLNVFSLVLL